MDSGIAKHDLTTLTQFQKELHGGYDDDDDDDEEPMTVFAKDFRKTSWYSHLPSPMICKGENPFIFTANTTFHFLKYVYAVLYAPALKVKPKHENKIQICWPHYLAHNIFQNGYTDVDGSRFSYFDSHILDINGQYKRGDNREHYDMMVGNVEMLTKWGNFLPEYPMQIPLPLDMARDPSHAFPIFYTNSKSSIDIVLNVRNKIVDLLRMRILVEKEEVVENESDKDGKPLKRKIQYWKEIPCNLDYIDGAGASALIRKPELWARYAYLTDKELKWWKTCRSKRIEQIIDETSSQEPEKVELENYDYYIDDYIACDAENTSSYGETASVTLNGKYPSKAIYFFAENTDATKNRNMSNYTTSIEDLVDGWDPCLKHTLSYGGTARINDMDNFHASNVECLYHEKYAPRDAGYHLISIADNPNSIDAELGIVMDQVKAKFSVKLGNSDPKLKPVMGDEGRYAELENINQEEQMRKGPTPKFKLRVRMLITRKITFQYNTKTGVYKFITH
jgi:hypothetical protein